MMVKIVKGYGAEKETAEQQAQFLDWFKRLLASVGLPVSSIASERKTGGEITLEVSDHLEFNKITRAFLNLATTLSQKYSREEGEQIDVSFDLVMPGCSEPIEIMGTGL